MLIALVALGLVALVFALSRTRRAANPAPTFQTQKIAPSELIPEMDRASLVPIIRPLGDAVAGAAFPVQHLEPVSMVLDARQVGEDVPHAQLPFMLRFVGNLGVRYAFDGAQTMINLSHEEHAKLGLSDEALRVLAIENLLRRYPHVEIHTFPMGGMVQKCGDLESSWLLHFDFWAHESRRFKGELVASVPSRDLMVWCDSADETVLAELRTNAIEVEARARASNRAISSLLYVWRTDHWEVFEPQRSLSFMPN